MINTDKISFTIAANDQISDADKFNDVVLSYRNGAPIRVRDVGQAVAAPVDRTVAGYQNNKDGVILAVSSSPAPTSSIRSTRSSRSCRSSRRAFRRRSRSKPFSTAPRRSALPYPTSSSRWRSTICLVVMVILLFLRNFWATLIPSVTVPLALAGAFAAMYLMHFSLDNLSLMALTIAVGFVVDDAIVVVENIYRHVEAWRGALRRSGAQRLARDRLHGGVDLLLAHRGLRLPLLLMSGIIGRLFREFSLTVTASIAPSLRWCR